MNCDVCGHDTIVLVKKGNERRRECTRCKRRFTSVEVLKEDHERQKEAIQTVREAAEKLKIAA